MTVDYCNNVKPILDRTCVSNCHGADHTVSGRADFRLDRYETVGAVKGAFEFKDRIDARTKDDSMPPIGDMVSPRPSQEERALLDAWFKGGGLQCDAGSGPADAGSSDAGHADAGDGGA